MRLIKPSNDDLVKQLGNPVKCATRMPAVTSLYAIVHEQPARPVNRSSGFVRKVVPQWGS